MLRKKIMPELRFPGNLVFFVEHCDLQLIHSAHKSCFNLLQWSVFESLAGCEPHHSHGLRRVHFYFARRQGLEAPAQSHRRHDYLEWGERLRLSSLFYLLMTQGKTKCRTSKLFSINVHLFFLLWVPQTLAHQMSIAYLKVLQCHRRTQIWMEYI